MSPPSGIKNPWALAGYALACMFGLAAKFGPATQYPWLTPLTAAMAVICLVGALLIAAGSSSRSRPKQVSPTISQRTAGRNSQNIAQVGGNVTISHGAKAARKDR